MKIKGVLKRFTCLLIAFAIILSYSFIEPMEAYAATLSHSIAGLGASYDNGEWTANGSSFSGSATGSAGGGCDSASATTSTLTLKNNSGSTAVLAFSYTKPVIGSGGSVKIDGTTVTAAGNFSKELEANGQITVVIVSGSAGAYTTSVTLNNITLVQKKSVTTTFATTTGGSYTVDGTAVTADITKTQDSTVPYAVTATPASGYKFVGWYDVNADTYINMSASAQLYITSNTIVKPVFVTNDTAIWEVGAKVFFDLNDAISYSSSQNISKITLIGSGSLPAGNYTVPSGKTLLIPFDDAKNIYTTSAEIVASNVYPLTDHVPSQYIRLTMQDGAKLTVKGNLSVSAKLNSFNNYYTAATTGKYGYIYMNSGSNIEVVSGGYLYCWGFISGQGEITAKSGSNVYEPFQICDMRGGTALNSMKSNSQKVLPFSQYYINNIEAPLKIEYGATEIAVNTITIQGFTSTTPVTFIGNSSSSLFKLENGSYFVKSHDPSTDKACYEIYGSATLNPISMTIKMSLVTVNINTANFVLPIMENTDLKVHSGTTTINQDICVLPGCEITVDKDATVKVASGKNIYLYDLAEWAGKGYLFPSSATVNCIPRQYSPTRTVTYNNSQMADARVNINGKIDATGKFFTTAGGADITSTQGTGKFTLTAAPTASTTTYQATQNGSEIAYNSISATAARLHNDESKNPSEPYTTTAGSDAGTTYTYSLQQGKWGNFKQYTVTFKNDDGTTIDTLTVTEGDTIAEDAIEAPEKEGYVFEGWFNGDDQLVFGETPVTGDITYTARYKENTYTYNEPTYVWADDNSTCTATAVCVEDPAQNKTETVSTSYVVTTQPTCETTGVGTYTATFTNEMFGTQTKTVTISAKNHDYGTPSYEWAADNSTVTARRICANDPSHVDTETVNTTAEVTKPATCEAKGETTYTATFENGAFATQTKTIDNINALGHNWNEGVITTDPTCTETGVKTFTCRVCGATRTETVDALSHDLEKTEVTPATCTTDGNIEYWTCQRCGKLFSDAAGEHEITQAQTVEEATGHDYGEPTYVWAADNSTVTATRVCANDQSHVETETVNTTSEVTKPATCEGKGETTYTATFANDAFATQTKTVDNIEALGHAYGTPTYDWAEDNSTVTATRVCANDPSHVETETANTTSEVTKPATCEEKGETTYTATFANDAFATQTKTVDNIDPLGHNWEFVELTWEGSDAEGYTATASYKCKNNEEHNRTVAAAMATETTDATCTVAGTVTYVATISESAAPDGVERTDSKVVTGQPLGHDYELTGWNWAEDLSTASAVFTCTRDASHVQTVDAEMSVTTTPATCDKAGSIVHVATVTFEDKPYTNSRSEELAALGHAYGTPTYEWAEDNSTVTATRVCANDPSHVETETVNTTSEVTKPATCESKGETTYTATFTNDAFATQTKTIDNIDAVGHNYGEPTYVWAEDNSTVTATRVCANDTSHVETETVETTSAVTTPATCEEAGVETFTSAAFENEAFAVQTKEVAISATGHAYGAATYVWAEDNSSVTATRVCANDASHVETETVAATSEVTTPATCEADGVRTFTSATFENEAFTVQTKEVAIDATGHDYGEPTYVWEEDNSTVTATRVCANDPSHVETETANTTSEVTKPATCEGKGETTYTATFTNDAFATQTKTVDNIDATGHAYGEPTYVWAEDNSTVTATAVCGNDESHVVTETVNTTSNTTPATCEADGQTVYTAEFENDLFKTQSKTVVLPAIGHNYGEPAYTWAEDNSKVVAVTICGNNPAHVVTEEVVPTYEVVSAATCEEAGSGLYTATFTNKLFSTQTREVAISATGHAYGEPTYNWAEDNSSVTATRVCANDQSHVETETVNTTSEVTKPATCEGKGETTYTATFANDAFATQTKTVDNIEALGHAYGTPTYDWAEDNSTVTATRVCANDPSHVETETANTTSEVTKPATCEEKGETTYTATFANDAFATQTKTVDNIDPLGHNWEFVELTWEGSDAEGYTATASYKCKNNEEHNRTVAAAMATETTDATCTVAGTVTYVATISESAAPDGVERTDSKVVTGQPLGHDYELTGWNWAEDLSTASAVFTCTRDASHVQTVDAEMSVTTTPATCDKAGSIVHVATVTFEDKPYTNSRSEELAALGHAYGTPTYEWAEDNSTVTATRVCANDPSHVETETVNTTSEVTKPATCESKGETTYTATFTNDAFATQTKTIDNIDAVGHNYGEPTYVWAEDNSTVTATRVCANDTSHVETETVETTSAVTTPATCEEAGVETFTSAAFENEAFAVQTKEVAISATGHAYGAATYVWAEDNSSVTATRVCANDASHVETETVETTSAVTTPATCEAEGVRTFTSAAFENEAFSIQTKEVAISAIGHAYGEPTYVWAEDNSSVTATRVCANDASHVETETVTATSAVTTPATCETDGVETFTSAAFENEAFAVQTKEVAISATGHAYGEPTYVWAADNSTVTATRVCANDQSHVETETVNTTSEVTKPATCEGKGETTYTATFANDAFATQTKTVDNIEALGHAYGTPTYDWAEDNSTVTATRICANDPSHVETETANTTSEVTKPATCEGKGETTYTATFANGAFATQTKTVDNIDPLGHNWEFVELTWEGSDAEGYTATASYKCKNNEEHNRTVAAAMTTETTDATCTVAGTVTYVATITESAAPDGVERTDRKVVTGQPLGHDYELTGWNWAEDLSTASAVFTCTRDASHVQTVDAEMSVTTTPATCDKAGSIVHVATVTFEDKPYTNSRSEELAALGHAYGTPTYEWAEDNSTVTATRVCANDASHVETETVAATSEVTTPATCEEAGVETFTSAAFENEAFTIQTKEVAISATGHAYGEPTYVWAEDNSTVTATRVCANDTSHVETETVAATSEVTTPATCEEAGVETFTSAAFENEAFAVQTKEVAISATGHAYGEPTYVWAEDNRTVTATRVCANDASHVETETVETTSAVTTPATCEAEGVRTFTSAAFENEAFSIQTKEVAISAIGHAYGEPTYVWAEDNSSVTATRVCTNDASHVETETVTATSAVTTPATCETDGVETFTSAAFENEAFAVQTKEVAISATGHAYGEPTYVWAEDNSTVTATRVCANDQSHVETETVNTTSEVTKPATCESKGETTYTATFTNDAFATQTKTIDNIDAVGHNYGEPTYVWAEDNSTVTATRVCANDTSHVETETVETTSAVTTPATCEEAGVETFTSATFENEAFAVQTKEVAISATGHAYGAATYVWAEDNSSVTATRVCANDASHVETETVAATSEVTTPATCEAEGVRTFTSATFENEAFTVQTKEVAISATGHAYGTPTYSWSDDKATVTAVSICGNNPSHILTETVDTTKDTVPATCETGGRTTYTAEFENPMFETQTETVETPAIGHLYGDPEYSWSDDKSQCTATSICKNDPSHVLTETVNSTSEQTIAPTCETEGEKTYTAVFTNDKFKTQTTTEVIPANGHSLVGTEAHAATCTEPGNSAYWTCSVCGKYFSDAEGTQAIEENSWVIPAKGHNLVATEAHAATCTEPGNKAYWTCSVCGEHFADEAATTSMAEGSWIIPAAGHIWDNGVVTTAATCTAEGQMLYTCTVCGTTRTEVIAKLPHTIREVAAVAPTCTLPGNSTYYVCDSCGHFFSDAEGTTEIAQDSWVIQANGHTWGEWVVITAPDCVNQGSEQRTCTVCGATESQNLDPNGHTWDEEFTIDQEPDCTTDGSKSRHCQFCDQRTDVTVIPALGHDWDTENVVFNWAEDYSTAEAVFTCKRDHSHVETLQAAVTSQTAAGIITYTASVVFEEATYTDTKTADAHQIIRISGKNRYETCIKIADYYLERNGIDKLSAVVLATGGDFPDALTGAYLANVKNAPIMLIDQSSSSRITTYLKNHLASDGTVYILGGQGAVSDSWLADLSGYTLKRMNGKNRYETNLSILNESGAKGGDILVCTGTNYADSLSASAIDMPILIVGGSLSADQKQYLEGASWNFHLVGGTSVVTTDIENELKAYGTIADRTYGKDRYATSKAMAERFVGETHEAILAYGANFPDGLCGGPLACTMGSPIILSGSTPATNTAGIQYTTGKSISSGLVLGGPALIDDQTVRTTFSMRESDEIQIYEQ